MISTMNTAIAAIIVGFILIGAKTPPQPDFHLTLGGKVVTVSGPSIIVDGRTITYENEAAMFEGLEVLSQDLFIEGIDYAIEHILENNLVVLVYNDGEVRAIVEGGYDSEEKFRTLNGKECDDYGTCLYYFEPIK